ncbi:hypothetical protein [uncultured Arcobacter sp.]|uniref:hypothetical protein n=1 Tax=uncultured Arcobacter sp. TaxID=165434 RepID=UPI0026162873|nr:hypothetical protein [uncultured Arcobacter sp.]
MIIEGIIVDTNNDTPETFFEFRKNGDFLPVDYKPKECYIEILIPYHDGLTIGKKCRLEVIEDEDN